MNIICINPTLYIIITVFHCYYDYNLCFEHELVSKFKELPSIFYISTQMIQTVFFVDISELSDILRFFFQGRYENYTSFNCASFEINLTE